MLTGRNRTVNTINEIHNEIYIDGVARSPNAAPKKTSVSQAQRLPIVGLKGLFPVEGVGVVVAHLTVARVTEGLDVAWDTANSPVPAEGKRLLIDDSARFDSVKVIGIDEHVWRHVALLFRMEVRDLHRLAVVAVG